MDNPYIEVPDPLDISKRVKARVLKFKLTDIQPFYAEMIDQRVRRQSFTCSCLECSVFGVHAILISIIN